MRCRGNRNQQICRHAGHEPACNRKWLEGGPHSSNVSWFHRGGQPGITLDTLPVCPRGRDGYERHLVSRSPGLVPCPAILYTHTLGTRRIRFSPVRVFPWVGAAAGAATFATAGRRKKSENGGCSPEPQRIPATNAHVDHPTYCRTKRAASRRRPG